MEKKYDLIVYIGRFQPAHVGHINTIQKALEQSNRVLVLVGSTNQPRTHKNPFTFSERATMIQHSLDDDLRLSIDSLPDSKYKMDDWIASVQSKVYHYLLDYSGRDPKKAKVGIIGYVKDNSSFYLKYFPQWDFIDTGLYDEEKLDATTIRRHLFEDSSIKYLEGVLSTDTIEFLTEFKKKQVFEDIQDEYNFLQEYDPREFPRNEVTADAVVVQSGHLLMIQRKNIPGKGLWALPGGFVNPNETIEDAMLRELDEETNLRVPKKVIRGSIVKREVFDSVSRSDRGRIITHAFLVKLKDEEELPRVTGGDDALEAEWIPISEVMENPANMYSDHWSIIGAML
jgi:bifunctional NMN adenylyltransferase/nudix hydrolase